MRHLGLPPGRASRTGRPAPGSPRPRRSGPVTVEACCRPASWALVPRLRSRMLTAEKTVQIAAYFMIAGFSMRTGIRAKRAMHTGTIGCGVVGKCVHAAFRNAPGCMSATRRSRRIRTNSRTRPRQSGQRPNPPPPPGDAHPSFFCPCPRHRPRYCALRIDSSMVCAIRISGSRESACSRLARASSRRPTLYSTMPRLL